MISPYPQPIFGTCQWQYRWDLSSLIRLLCNYGVILAKLYHFFCLWSIPLHWFYLQKPIVFHHHKNIGNYLTQRRKQLIGESQKLCVRKRGYPSSFLDLRKCSFAIQLLYTVVARLYTCEHGKQYLWTAVLSIARTISCSLWAMKNNQKQQKKVWSDVFRGLQMQSRLRLVKKNYLWNIRQFFSKVECNAWYLVNEGVDRVG